jgi:hypothetical protein
MSGLLFNRRNFAHGFFSHSEQDTQHIKGRENPGLRRSLCICLTDEEAQALCVALCLCLPDPGSVVAQRLRDARDGQWWLPCGGPRACPRDRPGVLNVFTGISSRVWREGMIDRQGS